MPVDSWLEISPQAKRAGERKATVWEGGAWPGKKCDAEGKSRVQV